MTPAWNDERPKHGIVLLRGTRLLCACGETFDIDYKDSGLSERVRHDILLDRHSAHRKARERRDDR